MALLPTIESELEPFEYRPHLVKLFTIAPTLLHSRFEKFPDFLTLLNNYDPKGKLRNGYLDKNIYG
jgi:alditol oxidase